ncbi:MAG TPA: pilus assembly protein PilM [Phycisphaerae bacterium]|jgi:type IV pilus assembly protein PilM|nr:pilus assembly protein PilM [Phycisphaerae bacterium]
MLKFFDKGLCPIGIDAGAHAVRLAQFRTAAEGLTLKAACRVELDSIEQGKSAAASLGAAVRHALAGEEFGGKRVVLSLPSNVVHSKSVRLPQMPDSDLNQALQWEAKDRFGFEIGDAAGNGAARGTGQLAWFRVGEVRRGTEVKDEILLFAVEGPVLHEYIEVISDVGLEIVAVDLAPAAIQRSIRRTSGETPGGTAGFLDVGHAGSQFFIMRGRDLVFFKQLDIGGKTINEAVAAKLGITPLEALQMRARIMMENVAEEAGPLAQALRDAMRPPIEEMAKEIDMCMRYYVVTFRGTRPEGIAVTGRQAACLQLRETLANALGLGIDEAQPLRGILALGDKARPDRSGEWAVAAGLSLYPTTVEAKLEAA